MREGWTYKKLGEVCDKSQNINWNKVSEDKQYTYIDLSSVDRECLSVINPQIINKTNAPSRAKQIVETGDVIFATTRPSLRRTCVIGDDYNGQICSTGFCVLRPQKQVLAKWIFYNLQYDGFYSYIEPLQTGANYPAVTDSVVKDYNIPIPSLSEQLSIVAELDKINELISLKKAQLSDLDSLAQSIFYDMFGDLHNTAFSVQTLNDTCEFIKDGTHQTPQYTEDKINGVKFLSAKDVVSGYIDWGNIKFIPYELHSELHKRIAPKRGDILLCKNGTTGICAVVDTDDIFDIYVSLALLRPKTNNMPEYLHYAINNPYTKQQFDDSLKGIGVPNLHLGEIKKTKIILPPLSLQQEFAKRIELIEQQKAQISSTIKDLETLLASRMQYWFD